MSPSDLVGDTQIEVPEVNEDLEQEIYEIGVEFVGGVLYQKRALARIARLIIEEKFRGKEIPNAIEGGKIEFVTQEELVAYITDLYGISRSSLMWQISKYRQLVGMGMDWASSFRAISRCPMALNTLPEIVTFDSNHNVVDVNLSKALALPHPDKEGYVELIKELSAKGDRAGLINAVVPQVRSLVDEMSTLNGREAAKMAGEVLGKNTVHFERVDGGVLAHFVERSVDEQGEVVESSRGSAQFFTGDTPPQWVMDKMYQKLGAIER